MNCLYFFIVLGQANSILVVSVPPTEADGFKCRQDDSIKILRAPKPSQPKTFANTTPDTRDIRNALSSEGQLYRSAGADPWRYIKPTFYNAYRAEIGYSGNPAFNNPFLNRSSSFLFLKNQNDRLCLSR